MYNYSMKTAQREEVVAALKGLLGNDWFIKPSEEFDGHTEGALWTTNERASAALGGNTIYEYDFLEVHPKVETILETMNWFIEPYDRETLFIYPK